MSDSEATTRRDFLKTAALASAALAAGSAGCAQSRSPRWMTQPRDYVAPRPPGGKLRIGFIGTGGIGGYHLEETAKLNIACPCYCDVDTNRQAKAKEMYPDARAYQDYREMLEKEQGNIDAVMVGTPDHHHFPATMLAMKRGLHVYTQKPLTHTPWEARQLAKVAAEYKLATQMGNQGHAGEGWRLVYEWYNSGALGHVTEVHTWTDRPIWPQGMGRPEGEDSVPANLDWDCWLGPAPERPYKGPESGDGAGPYHWFNWRGWWDFGAGALGDMACHTMDCVFATLEPGYPTAIEPLAMTTATNEAFPNASALKWEFPRNGRRRAFTAYWYDGGLKPPIPPDLEAGRDLPRTGNLFIGTEAVLMISGDYADSPRIIPEARMKKVGKPPKLIERSPGHIDEWVMAASGEKPIDFPKSNFAYAGPFTEAILLGNIALRVNRRLEWDAEKMEFTNFAEANQYVSKEYREGWRV